MGRYGTGIVLIAFGAVLAFAVLDMFPDLDLRMIGWILMAAGALALLLALAGSGADGGEAVNPDRPGPDAAPGQAHQERAVRQDPPVA